MILHCIDCCAWTESLIDKENMICTRCNSNNVIELPDDISTKDIDTLHDISKDKNFWQAMINLRQTDIIEYELKMSQFRQQLEQQKQTQDNRPKCPTCGSTYIAKIDGLERAGSIAVFGLFSKKINKTFKCKNCGHTW